MWAYPAQSGLPIKEKLPIFRPQTRFSPIMQKPAKSKHNDCVKQPTKRDTCGDGFCGFQVIVH
jgi:hypothetical protein